MTLIGLPPALLAAAVVIASLISGLLGAASTVVNRIPGLRPQDDTRNYLMRVLIGALNLGALLLYAWSQRIVIVQEAVPALVLTAFGVTLGVHYVYTGIKSGAAAAAAQPATVPPVPADALPA